MVTSSRASRHMNGAGVSLGAQQGLLWSGHALRLKIDELFRHSYRDMRSRQEHIQRARPFGYSRSVAKERESPRLGPATVTDPRMRENKKACQACRRRPSNPANGPRTDTRGTNRSCRPQIGHEARHQAALERRATGKASLRRGRCGWRSWSRQATGN